jgi:hypothetical protein
MALVVLDEPATTDSPGKDLSATHRLGRNTKHAAPLGLGLFDDLKLDPFCGKSGRSVRLS